MLDSVMQWGHKTDILLSSVWRGRQSYNHTNAYGHGDRNGEITVHSVVRDVTWGRDFGSGSGQTKIGERVKGVDLGMGRERSFQAEKTQALGWEEPWHIQGRPGSLQGRTQEEKWPP